MKPTSEFVSFLNESKNIRIKITSNVINCKLILVTKTKHRNKKKKFVVLLFF